MGLTTTIKNSIMALLVKITQTNNLKCKVIGSQFDQDDSNTNCEILVAYADSTWEISQPGTKTANNLYDRTLTFNIFLRLKNIRTEDAIQDFNDLIIDNLGLLRIGDTQIVLVSDNFVDIDNGIWTYQQVWNVPIRNVAAVNPDDPNVCTFPLTGPAFKRVEITIVPTHDFVIDTEIGYTIPRN